MIVVGITGDLGSGKTTVAAMFRELGAEVLDADKIAHRVIRKNSPAYKKIIKVFGRSVLAPSKEISRRKLGAAAFRDEDRWRQICAIIHPPVLKYARARIGAQRKKRARAGVLVVDAALLIETGLYRDMDFVLAVQAGPRQKLRRAQTRGRLTLQEAKQRLRFQLPFKEKMRYADAIIDNRRGLARTRAQAAALWNRLKKANRNSIVTSKGEEDGGN